MQRSYVKILNLMTLTERLTSLEYVFEGQKGLFCLSQTLNAVNLSFYKCVFFEK